MATDTSSTSSELSSEFNSRRLARMFSSGRLRDAVRYFAQHVKREQLSLARVPPVVWEQFVSACATCRDAVTADLIVRLLEPHLAAREPETMTRIRIGAVNAHRRAGNLERVRELARSLPPTHLSALDVRVRAAASSHEVLRIIHGAQQECAARGETLLLDARLFASALVMCRHDAAASDFLWKLAQSERPLWAIDPARIEMVLSARIVVVATNSTDRLEASCCDELIALWSEIAAARKQRAASSAARDWASDCKMAYNETLAFCSVAQHGNVARLLAIANGVMPSAMSPEVDAFQATVLQAIRVLNDPARSPTDVDAVVDRVLARLPALSEAVRKPDLVLLNCVVNLLTRAGRMDEAADLADNVMPRFGFEPDLYTLNTLISGWVKACDVPRAFAVFHRLAGLRLQPTMHTILLLYRACGVLAEQSKADARAHIAQVDAFRGELFADDMPVHNARLNALLLAGDEAGADALVAGLRARRLPLDSFTFNTLLLSATRQFKSIYQRVKENGGGTVDEQLAAQVDQRLRRILTDMADAGVEPNIMSYSMLIDTSRSATQFRAFYERMLLQGIKPDEVVLRNLVRACTRAPWSADTTDFVLAECVAYGFVPSQPQLRVLIQRSLQANDYDHSLALLARFEKDGWLVPAIEGQLMLAFLLSYLKRSDNEAGALRLVRERFGEARITRMQLQIFDTALAEVGYTLGKELDDELINRIVRRRE
jgi:pentatricopeptide repeat protein